VKSNLKTHAIMKTQHFIYCLTIVAVLFTACKKDKEQELEQGIPVTGVTLNKTELMLAPGDTVTLIATVEPDSATNKTVTWTSSKTSVATVNSNGLVTAIGKGDATITVITKDGKKTATCLITVGDYRAKWVGEYIGEYIYYLTTMDGTSIDTTSEAIVNVSTWEDSYLLITYEGAQWMPEVNTDGYFEQYPDNPYGYSECRGIILNDSISFEGTYSMSPGHRSYYKYKGKKQ